MLNNRLAVNEAFSAKVDHISVVENELKQRVNHPKIQEIISYLRGISEEDLIDDAGKTLAKMVQECILKVKVKLHQKKWYCEQKSLLRILMLHWMQLDISSWYQDKMGNLLIILSKINF